jgi:glucokinase
VRLGPRLMGGVQEVIAEWEGRSPFIHSLQLGKRVTLIDSDSPVAALGAAHLGAIASHG